MFIQTSTRFCLCKVAEAEKNHVNGKDAAPTKSLIETVTGHLSCNHTRSFCEQRGSKGLFDVTRGEKWARHQAREVGQH